MIKKSYNKNVDELIELIKILQQILWRKNIQRIIMQHPKKLLKVIQEIMMFKLCPLVVRLFLVSKWEMREFEWSLKEK